VELDDKGGVSRGVAAVVALTCQRRRRARGSIGRNARVVLVRCVFRSCSSCRLFLRFMVMLLLEVASLLLAFSFIAVAIATRVVPVVATGRGDHPRVFRSVLGVHGVSVVVAHRTFAAGLNGWEKCLVS